MRLGILSDTHNQLERTERAVRLLQSEGAEVLAHCGDIFEPRMIPVCALLPCYFVFGNHDSDLVPHLERAIQSAGGICLGWGGEVTLGAKRVALVHGHMSTDVRRLIAARPDYLLSGHSHIPTDRREGSVRRINPGALHEADSFTVAILDLESDDLRFLTLPEREV